MTTLTEFTETIFPNGSTVVVTSERIPFGTDLFWIYVGIYVFLSLCSGLYAGLTVGILSLDPMTLKVVSESGATEKQRNRAKRVLPIVQRHHLVLVSLVLANAAAVEAMPVFLNGITNEVVAIAVSVTVVLFLGEILPQALCTKYGLAIGSFMAPLIYFTIFIFFPLTYPIAKLLDCVLGKDHHTFYRRQELKALVAMHGPPKEGKNGGRSPTGSKTNLLDAASETADLSDGGDSGSDHQGPLTRDEVMVIEGVLNLKEKSVAAAMLPFDKVFMLGMDSVLDYSTFDKIVKEGFSRIPVYDGFKQNIVKILLVKTLITVNPEDRVTIRNLLMRAEFHAVDAAFVNVDRPLSDVLNDFKASRAGHLSIVYKEIVEEVAAAPRREVVGIVTLEDVIEEMLQVEIYDEFDTMPRIPTIPGYLHYRKVHRVHSHWEGAGKFMDSMEASANPPTQETRSAEGRGRLHRRNTSAGHVDRIASLSPTFLRRKFNENGSQPAQPRALLAVAPDFYLTDPESGSASSCEFNVGSFDSIVAQERLRAARQQDEPALIYDSRSEHYFRQHVMDVLAEAGSVVRGVEEGNLVTHAVQLHRDPNEINGE